jgi:hypothetical protein
MGRTKTVRFLYQSWQRVSHLNKNSLTVAVAAGVLLFAGPVCKAGVITLNFEGIDTYPDGSNVLIQNYYNGGTASNGVAGPNFGVTFTTGATLLCMNTTAAPGCSNTSKGGVGVAGSQNFAMFFPSTNPIMDVAAGFTTGFSMAYSNPNAATLGVQIWSGVDGTGALLASTSLGGTTDGIGVAGCFSSNYCPFSDF